MGKVNQPKLKSIEVEAIKDSKRYERIQSLLAEAISLYIKDEQGLD